MSTLDPTSKCGQQFSICYWSMKGDKELVLEYESSAPQDFVARFSR